jgi:hemerythrin-like domain-containing protein
LSKRTSQPAYTATTIMGIVHDALRRDLVRLQSALGSAPPPDGDRRVAIADHARWMMDFLHHHHQAEDTGLWPLIRQRAPQAQGLLDRMQADHAHLTSAAERLRQAAARYRADAGDQPRADFRDAVSGLSQALLPHLRGEEDEAMPLVAAVPRAIPGWGPLVRDVHILAYLAGDPVRQRQRASAPSHEGGRRGARRTSRPAGADPGSADEDIPLPPGASASGSWHTFLTVRGRIKPRVRLTSMFHAA